MSRIILVTGGARSGKSSFAENIARVFGDKVLYVATSVPFDSEMQDRIKKHRDSRPSTWETLEAYKNFDSFLSNAAKGKLCILLDCITVMITNIMFEEDMDFNNIDIEKANMLESVVAAEIKKLIETCRSLDMTVILVTNEVGMGIVPDNVISRVFRDIAGRMNQLIAREADEVHVCISGIPLRLK